MTQSRHLLSIAAELRNQIYYHVLLDEEGEYDEREILEIDGSNSMLPAIMRTSRQLREETRQIYFDYHQFHIQVSDIKFGSHRDHWVWRTVYRFELDRKHSWANFKEWMKLYYEDPTMPILEDATLVRETDTENTILSEAFETVRALAEAGTEWKVVEKVMESFRKAAEVNRSNTYFAESSWDGND